MSTLSPNTRTAYAADWTHYSRWCRFNGVDALAPSTQQIASYLQEVSQTLALTTVERRLSGLTWNLSQRGLELQRDDPAISKILDQIRQTSTHAPKKKEALTQDEIHAMVATLPLDLRGMRDRALLLLAYAAGLGRTQVVGLDVSGRTNGGTGTVVSTPTGLHVTTTTKTGDHTVEVARTTHDQTCPVRSLERWLRFAKVSSGPIFLRTSRDGKRVLDARLSDKHVARLIKQTANDARLRPELSDAERQAAFSGQSLRG